MSSFNSSFLILSILLALFAKSNITAAETQIDIKNLCSKAIDPTMCETALGDPRVKAANLPELLHNVLEKTQSGAMDTLSYVKSLVNKATDSVEKKNYESCLEKYGEVVDSLNKAKNDIKSKDYFSASFAVSAAQTYIDKCNDDIMGISKGIEERNGHLIGLGSTVLVVCNQATDEI